MRSLSADQVEEFIAKIPAGRMSTCGDIGAVLANYNKPNAFYPEVPARPHPRWFDEDSYSRSSRGESVKYVILYRLPLNYHRVLLPHGKVLTLSLLQAYRDQLRKHPPKDLRGMNGYEIVPPELSEEGLRDVSITKEPRDSLIEEGVQMRQLHGIPTNNDPYLRFDELISMVS